MVVDSLPQFLHVILCLYERHCDPIHTSSAGKLDVLLVLPQVPEPMWPASITSTSVYMSYQSNPHKWSVCFVIKRIKSKKPKQVSRLPAKTMLLYLIVQFQNSKSKQNLSTLRNLTRIDVDQRCDPLFGLSVLVGDRRHRKNNIWSVHTFVCLQAASNSDLAVHKRGAVLHGWSVKCQGTAIFKEATFWIWLLTLYYALQGRTKTHYADNWIILAPW